MAVRPVQPPGAGSGAGKTSGPRAHAAPPFRSGIVAIIGAPNAGKSTFLNRVLGEKLSITSKKPQTTRNRILGVMHRPGSQILFLDTPGVFSGAAAFNSRLIRTALSALSEADVTLVMLDIAAPDPAGEALLLESLGAKGPRVILALNKIDLLDRKIISSLMERWTGAYAFEAVFPISAKTGTGIDEMVEALERQLPEGPPYFAKDALTDMPTRFLVAERIREQVFRKTGQEIPYAAAVTVDAFSRRPDPPFVRIRATIHVERESQKGIVIGKTGQKLKEIGTEARREIEAFLECPVFLELFVRVQKDWRKDKHALKRFGYG